MTIMPQWGVFVRLIVSDAGMGQGCRTIRGTVGEGPRQMMMTAATSTTVMQIVIQFG